MAAFYTDAFGLQPVEATRMENWVEFEAGGASFSLHAIPREIAQSIEIATPPRPREQSAVKLSFETGDVAAECARLKSLGVTIVERPWGDLDAIDPEGNVIGLRPAGVFRS